MSAERDLLDRAAALVVAKKGARPTVVDMGASSIPTSYFLIVSGENPVHVRALADELLAKMPLSPRHIEGMREGRWALLDYGDFVVHLFHDEVRAFYDIEGIWPPAQVVPWGACAPLPPRYNAPRSPSPEASGGSGGMLVDGNPVLEK